MSLPLTALPGVVPPYAHWVEPMAAVTVSQGLGQAATTTLVRVLLVVLWAWLDLAGLEPHFLLNLPPFSFHRKFAICLASNGVIFFGDGPYNFLPNVQYTSQSLTFTPLFINPVSTASASTQGEPSAEYFIGVTSIKIDDKTVPLNSTLLTIDGEGNGGTKISTVNPYTVVESSIFKAVTETFISEAAARNITRVDSVAPFDVCFSTENVLSTRLGYGVPTISLVLQNENVTWSIFGANSVVQVSDDVLCLGLVNGGSNPRTSIVIGGYQLENNLLQFDLATSRLGFSSLLFGRQTTCSNFNFTSIA
ncbi:hypothetical protein GH714_024740 [Hevea brasiliensis]|uniref:Peptidase A1 domain-containing protein n=1 Tax=Hevea brasiliensis TaxID=3981 RepID=A0A6A6NJ47_HEVBR|nr:hypothetical protein GH714_024740 [Hevea brasiliensis]